MQERVSKIISIGSQGFSDRSSLESLWQEMALNFYVERADFTTRWSLGEEFASHLTTSYPMLARRDLGNAIQSMLRPRGENWFKMGLQNTPDVTAMGKQWLEYSETVMRHYMFDRKAGFVRATGEADHDYATFGNACLSVEYNRDLTGLIYRCWHIRDVVWFEDEAGFINEVHRKWELSAVDMISLFGADKCHREIIKAAKENTSKKFEVRHIVVSSEKWKTRENGKEYKQSFVSMYVDVSHDHVIEESGTPILHYVIPRWQTISGSQYAYSPAAVCALPDARLIQSMSLTLLEAGEKSVNPPLIATMEAVRSDISMHAGGITWADYEYDERLGDVLRPMNIDKSGLAFGVNIREETKQMIQEAFFLNKLSLPQQTGQMTATEVSQRVQEYIRQALPLFQSIEMEYNGALCDMTFDLLMARNAFGSSEDIPEELQGRDLEFTFKSPLVEAKGKEKTQKYIESSELLRQAAELDPNVVRIIDHEKAIRDTFTGNEVPENWLKTEDEMQEILQQEADQAEQQKQMEMMAQAGQVAQETGKGIDAMGGVE